MNISFCRAEFKWLSHCYQLSYQQGRGAGDALHIWFLKHHTVHCVNSCFCFLSVQCLTFCSPVSLFIRCSVSFLFLPYSGMIWYYYFSKLCCAALTIVCQHQDQSALLPFQGSVSSLVLLTWLLYYQARKLDHFIRFSDATATPGFKQLSIILSPWNMFLMITIWFRTSRRCWRWYLIPDQWATAGQLSSAANLSLRSPLRNITQCCCPCWWHRKSDSQWWFFFLLSQS